MASSPSTSSATSPNESQGSNANRSSFQKYLTNCRSLYSCIYCRTHLANHDELVSRSFQGNHGRAYLFKSVINVSCGPPVQRDLTTGPHAVADIFCADCERTLGWKYEKAYVESQKYKEGKYIIELAHVVRENRHLELDKGEIYFSRNERRRTSSGTSQNSSSSSTTSSSSSSSKLPPSPSNCHSPSNCSSKGRGEASSSAHPFHVDDEEEELMFPFYEDLLACRSSNLSLSHHQRMRRSLYLDSTPYDWKYSTTSSSAGQSGGTATTKIASSLDSSSDLSPSKSSSSDNSLDNRQISYHISNSINQICQQPDASIAGCCQNQRVKDKQDHCDNNNDKFNEGENNDNLDGDKNKVDGDDDVDDDDDDEETQFEFEEDKPHSSLSDNAQLRKMQCDRLDGNCVIGAQNSSNLNIDNENGEVEAEKQHSDEDSDTSLSSSNGASGSNDSVILDDETFYDCYTDHGISNSVPLSGSTSTLKQ